MGVKHLKKKAKSDNIILLEVTKRICSGHIGVSPSGKATDSDSVIREFESLHPSQEKPVEHPRCCMVSLFLYKILCFSENESFLAYPIKIERNGN